MQQSNELKNLALQFYKALAVGDFAAVDHMLSKENGTLGIGTEPKEWMEGYAELARVLKVQLEETGGFPFVADNPRAWSEGTVGWAADHPKLKLPDGTEKPARLTVIFHQEDDTWKIIHVHVSFGVSNEEVFGQTLTT